MLSTLSNTETAFVLLAVMQAVIALVWVVGGRILADPSGATVNWAAFAGASALSFVLLVAMTRVAEPTTGVGLRAASNIMSLVALLFLRHGVRRFMERPATPAVHAVALAVVLWASWVGRRPDAAALRVGVISGMLALLSVGLARDLYRHGRDRLKWRSPVVLAMPILFGTLLYGSRSVQALLWPASVSPAIGGAGGITLASALVFLVLAVVLHAMLMALVVARLISRLQHLSRRDALTGLLNRRALDEVLAGQLQRSRRSGEPLVIVMVDIDHFKTINDRFGHAAGDLALQRLSALLQSELREVDSLARIGGEEFLALLPATVLAVAVPVAERLRRRTRAEPLRHGEQCLGLSISVGLAEWRGPDEGAADVVARADAALLRAKAEGRDRVVVDDAPARR